MDLKQIISTMTPEIRDNMARAVEIGRWPDGTRLTDEQRSNTLQAVIAWDAYYGDETDEPFKVQKGGDIIRTVKKSSSTGKDVIKTINIDS